MVLKASIITRNYRRNLKIRTLVKMGGKCRCCGITDNIFLTIHHKNKDGGLETKTNRYRHYSRVCNTNDYSDLELLCHNCHFAVTHLGKCIHDI